MDVTPNVVISVHRATDKHGGWNVFTHHIQNNLGVGVRARASWNYVRESLPSVIAEHIEAVGFVTGTIRVKGRTRRKVKR